MGSSGWVPSGTALLLSQGHMLRQQPPAKDGEQRWYKGHPSPAVCDFSEDVVAPELPDGLAEALPTITVRLPPSPYIGSRLPQHLKMLFLLLFAEDPRIGFRSGIFHCLVGKGDSILSGVGLWIVPGTR